MKSTAFILFLLTASLLVACGGGTTDADSGQDTGIQDVATDLGTQDPGTQDPGGADHGASDAVIQDSATDSGSDVDEDVPTDATEPENIGLNPMYSECGGFQPETRLAEEDPNCGDETLEWDVDSESGVLTFTNTDVFLNCCGIHDIQVTVQDGVYVITETDRPADGEGRCFCQCLFDFQIQIPPIDGDAIDVRIERVVTDEGTGEAVVAWEGRIDTTTGQGIVTIKEDVGWCNQGIDIGTNPRASGCGGFDAPRSATSGETGCPDEVLNWQFDAVGQTLAFINSSVDLNCCGIHEIQAFFDAGVYHLAETDAPDDESGRCKCMCLFDFAIDVSDVVGPTIEVRLSRDLTDDDFDRGVVWEGSIDLLAGSGTITIRENTGACD